MFEDCKTLADLNQARVMAVRTHDVVEVNNAYNLQRKKILESRKNYVPITFKDVPVFEHSPIVFLNYKGPASKAGAIEMRQDGIYV